MKNILATRSPHHDRFFFNTTRIELTLMMLLLLPLTAAAQQIEWEKRYGGAAKDYGYVVTPTEDGGYAMGGSTASLLADSTNRSSGYIVKVDRYGAVEWEKPVMSQSDSGASNLVRAIFPKPYGYMILGTTSSLQQKSRIFLVRMDPKGAILHETILSTGEISWISRAVRIADSGYAYIGGNYAAPLFMRLTADGLPGEMIGLDSLDQGSTLDDLRSTADGGFAITSRSESVVLIRLDASGHAIWRKKIGRSASAQQYESHSEVIETEDGGFIVAGTYTTAAKSFNIVRVDSNGAILWSKNFLDDPIASHPVRLLHLVGGDFAVIGARDREQGNRSLYVITFDGNGEKRSYRSVLSHGETPYEAAPTGDGGIIITGEAGDITGSASNGDAWLLKLSMPTLGVEQQGLPFELRLR